MCAGSRLLESRFYNTRKANLLDIKHFQDRDVHPPLKEALNNAYFAGHIRGRRKVKLSHVLNVVNMACVRRKT